jgi:hypothetical protein
MKLGLILECSKQGTDHQVYEYVIKKLCHAIEIVVVPSGSTNKPGMIAKCGIVAKTLMEADQCNKVSILWDLIPAWGGTACRKDDVEAITCNLNAANVDLSKIKLICIEPELEGWLIVEGTAITKYKTDICHPHPVKKFNGVKLSAKSNDSKKTISKYLGRRYNDISEAIRIAKNIDDFDKLARKHESFARLKTFIEEICR